MNHVIDKTTPASVRRHPSLASMAIITGLIAALSTALCMQVGLPAWGMFAGWIVFVTGGGGAKAGFAALGSALLGLLLGVGGGAAIAASSGLLGALAVPVVVFAIVALAVVGQRTPLCNSVISYFVGMTVYFASSLPPSLLTYATLGASVAVGVLSGLLATTLIGMSAAISGSRV